MRPLTPRGSEKGEPVDYLIYSMASAELRTLSEESHEVLNSYKAIVSSNVRTLLA